MVGLQASTLHHIQGSGCMAVTIWHCAEGPMLLLDPFLLSALCFGGQGHGAKTIEDKVSPG